MFVRARLEGIAGFSRFALALVRALLFTRLAWAKWSRLAPQLYSIGTRSVPVLGLTGAFIGAILAIEGYAQFRAFGQEHRLGGAITISIVKQIGPVLAAVMLAGRVGCSLTAELGSMRVTDQLDAMRVLGSDPVRVLAAPRVAACIIMIPILTTASNICGIAGGWLVAVPIFGVNHQQYWDFTRDFVGWFDVANGLVKSIFFGAAIGLIACHKGFHCRPGAQGVGRATTEAFVASFVSIIMVNLVLAKFLNDMSSLRGEFKAFFS